MNCIGTTSTLQCAPHRPKPDYYRDASRFNLVGDGPEYRLEIPDAKLDFTGTYTIYAKNCHGDAKAIISLQIKVRDPSMPVGAMDRKKIGAVKIVPKIETELRDIRCCDGDSATFECKVEATPPPDIRWERAGKLLHLGGDFTAEFDGQTAKLTIAQVYPEDEGEYTCVAYNELGKAFTSACLVVDLPEEKDTLLRQQLRRPAGLLDTPTPSSTPRVTPIRSVSPYVRRREPPAPVTAPSVERVRRIRATAPKFYARPHDRVAEEGETVRFQCAVAGHPARIRITEKEDLRTLEISDVTTNDSGSYRVILGERRRQNGGVCKA
nr:unnamed protein product [Callosobruchus chinensis]